MCASVGYVFIVLVDVLSLLKAVFCSVARCSYRCISDRSLIYEGVPAHSCCHFHNYHVYLVTAECSS